MQLPGTAGPRLSLRAPRRSAAIRAPRWHLAALLLPPARLGVPRAPPGRGKGCAQGSSHARAPHACRCPLGSWWPMDQQRPPFPSVRLRLGEHGPAAAGSIPKGHHERVSACAGEGLGGFACLLLLPLHFLQPQLKVSTSTLTAVMSALSFFPSSAITVEGNSVLQEALKVCLISSSEPCPTFIRVINQLQAAWLPPQRFVCLFAGFF